MNKIILDRESIVFLNINSDSICNIDASYKINELNIEISDSIFIINHYSEINESKLKINVIQNNNSKFVYNHSFKNNGIYNLDMYAKLCGNNSKNIINIHGVSNSGESNIVIDGKIVDNTIDNELDESVRLININKGKCSVLPNMYIDTKNVLANHKASISDIDKNYLFYLNSKGIDKKESIKLIIDGFLNNEAR